MQGLYFVLRFFRIVPPVAPLLTLAMGATTMAAGVLVGVAPERAAAAFTPILLVQGFAASSGFLLPARRGHYDLLLTSGQPRLAVAAVHWLMSILPGMACWGLLALVEALTGAGNASTLRSSGTMVALVVVSTLPWALTVRLPRFAGAIGWLLVLAVFVTVTMPGPQSLPRAGPGEPLAIRAALMILLYPPAIVGEPLGGGEWLLALPALVAAAAAMTYALIVIHRDDIPLEAAQ